jgi:hypothetical protein
MGASEYTATIEIEALDPDTVPPPPRADSFPVPILDGGGLYGGGSNAPPALHHDAGLFASAQVPASGAVLVSLGMSLTKAGFDEWFKVRSPTDAVFVHGACGGCVVDEWDDATDPGWANAFTNLAAKGLTGADVDVVWMSVTREQHLAASVSDLETILLRIKEKYPNARQVFVFNRTYGGFRTKGTVEPAAWEDGQSVRQFVLNHLGETAPWIGWTGDVWANGDTPRSDGLYWTRADFQSDGIHYSATGKVKFGKLVRDQFEASPFTAWYQP